MKKFGTVSGVTCGRVKLKLGFEISGGVPEPAGAPGLVVAAGGFGADTFGAAGLDGDGTFTFGLGRVFGFGVGTVWVVEVLLLELELDELLELLELLLELLDELELDEVDGGGQDSDELATGPGRFRDDSGVPGASWKYSV